ncbi:MAG: molybdenum cofactor guanylyltransferase [Bacteroidia bacterium]
MKITGIILAGGKSSRMGTDKGLAQYNNIPMIAHVIKALKPITDDVIIVTSNDQYNTFGYPVIADLIKDSGPLAGLYTGLFHSKNELNVCLSCDIPLISTEIILRLTETIKKKDAAIALHSNKIHPLIGVYKKHNYANAKKQIEQGNLRLKDFLNIINTHLEDVSDFNKSMFNNINTLKELNETI